MVGGGYRWLVMVTVRIALITTGNYGPENLVTDARPHWWGKYNSWLPKMNVNVKKFHTGQQIN